MKSLIATFFVAASLFGAGSVMAEPTPQANCLVRMNNHPTGEYVRWNRFFSRVHEYSQSYGCAVGKIAYTSESGRMYVNGRKVGNYLSNSEIARLKADYGYSHYSCPTFTCDEVGRSRPRPRY